ncbi:MAG TPA: hypothetical protein DHW71_12275 [Gammaproteobacteria bacterium]|nr:hypothetical protein [Gammaproteobacteria bacterium]HBF07178.1 hypothetical protein [Gammaproteobacteria bacterium]HCK93764.1 hypothetical protein [Gammaproteobacteria bacterium]|tara:strand:+ start:569 stop:1768 length:1200 start_codon:yes stop_codon:yes gene_type:complete
MKTQDLINQGFTSIATKSQAMMASRLWFVPYLIIMVGLAALGGIKPNVGWDVVGYTGSALTFAGEEDFHKQAYSLVKEALPQEYNALITDNPTADRPSTYRSTMFANQDAFQEQLAYYQIRPLFVGAMALAYKAGFNPVHMLLLISVLSTIGITLLVYRRLVQDITPFLAAFFGISLVLYLRLPSYAGLTTVDPLLGFVFTWFVLSFEKGANFSKVIVFCLLLILIRSNAVVFTFPILMMSVLAKPLDLKITQLSLKQGIIAGVSSLVLMKLIEGVVGNYGWWTVYYFTFVESLNFPTQFQGSFDLGVYIKGVLEGARWLLSDRFTTLFYLFISMVLIGLSAHKDARNKAGQGLLVLAFAIIFIGHFLLFPLVMARFYFPLYVLSGVYACLVMLPPKRV